MSKVATNPKLQVLYFLIENVNICIELPYIHQVLPLSMLDSVPGAPPYLAGLMNIGSLSVPIIDLGILLNLPRETTYTINTPVLLCSDKQQNIGLIIDEVIGLALIEEEAQMKEQFNQENSLFQAIITIDSQQTLLLNMTYLFSINLICNPSTEYSEYK